jgi:isopentenyl-diphosphate delta-isomerase
MQVEYVILVNNNDQSLGTMEKMEAHEKGIMHRAISVFVFNTSGEMLLQKRAGEKYHSAGLWSNTACSHPRTAEKTADAAHRRLKEEMGFDCELEEAFSFTYKAHVGEGLTEHEYDHVFVGHSDEKPDPDPDEVSDWKYVDFDSLMEDIENNPDAYTVWFKIAVKELKKHLSKV